MVIEFELQRFLGRTPAKIETDGVFSFVSRIRKYLEDKSLLNKYREIKLYADWVLHPSIDRRLSTHTTSVEYDKITDVSVKEPFIERLITKTRHLAINTAGTGAREVVLKHITAPYEVRKKLDRVRDLISN